MRINLAADNEVAAKDADIVIAAADVTSSFINLDLFKPGAIICDAGYPRNVCCVPSARNDIFIFSGGFDDFFYISIESELI